MLTLNLLPMRERIRLILEHYGITQTKFAELIGVSKGMVSHVMSVNGRHSEFTESTISKIKEAFPKINIEWLLSGKGSMFTSENNNLHSPEQQQLFDFPTDDKVNTLKDSKQYAVNNILPNDVSNVNTTPIAENTINAINVAESPQAEYQKTNQANYKTSTPTSTISKIASRIVIFYTDGTYSEYKPDQTSY